MTARQMLSMLTGANVPELV
jgi:hypothetical protein